MMMRTTIVLAICIAAFLGFASALEQKWTIPLKEGDTVPSVTFKTRTRVETDSDNPFDWKDLTSDDYFKGKRVVLFALPGAFTPTCSTSHLPEYQDAYDILMLGIDDVYCLSVNDAFVMRQWGLHLGLEEDKTLDSLGFTQVKLIPDGAAAFTRGMGIMSCLWDTERGFGERSWRYSMVVNDGVIEKLFVENDGQVTQNSGPDPFQVSNAKTMLTYLQQQNDETFKRGSETEL